MVMERLEAVQSKLVGQGRFGMSARLLPTTAATTVRKGREPFVIDGPFAETKEQLLGFYLIDCADLDDAVETAKELAIANGAPGAYELRPVGYLDRKSTRLNSSHANISYAVFCLKKKNL